MSKLRTHTLAVVFVALAFAPMVGAAQSLTQITLPPPIPLGTTQGDRVDRLIIKNAIVVSGRGTPRSNRAMPPEGPIDIVIEGNRIVNMIPVDPVNAAGYQEGQRAASGSRVIDARTCTSYQDSSTCTFICEVTAERWEREHSITSIVSS